MKCSLIQPSIGLRDILKMDYDKRVKLIEKYERELEPLIDHMIDYEGDFHSAKDFQNELRKMKRAGSCNFDIDRDIRKITREVEFNYMFLKKFRNKVRYREKKICKLKNCYSPVIK